MTYEFTDEYDSIDAIAQQVIKNCANAQDIPVEDVEIVPVTAIDEAEMPRALKNPDSLTQHEWDTLRDQIIAAVNAHGPRVE